MFEQSPGTTRRRCLIRSRWLLDAAVTLRRSGPGASTGENWEGFVACSTFWLQQDVASRLDDVVQRLIGKDRVSPK